MNKSFISVALLLSICLLGYAQERKTVIKRMQVPSYKTQAATFHPVENKSIFSIGEKFIYSGLDYVSDNAIPNMIDLFDIDQSDELDPIFTAAQQLTSNGQVHQMLGYRAYGAPIDSFDSFNGFDYKSGTIRALASGPLADTTLIMSNKDGYLSISRIAMMPYPVFHSKQDFPLISAPVSFVYLDAGTIFLVSKDQVIYKSTDGARTFTEYKTIGEGDPEVNLAAATFAPSEFPISISQSNKYISIVGAFEGAAVNGNPDIVYLYRSTDYGETWIGEIIGRGSSSNPEYGQVSNVNNYAPYFTNFAQVNCSVANDGITHVAANGYGERVVGQDTLNYFPMLYWNTKDKQWIEISDTLYSQPEDDFGNKVVDLYSGNAIGQAYPVIASWPDGSVVTVFWTAPEYATYYPTHRLSIYPGDGSMNSSPKYYTDIKYITYVNGVNWVSLSRSGNLNNSEMYVSAYKYIKRRFDFVVDVIFYNDVIPGSSLFPMQNSFSSNSFWNYAALLVILMPSVDDDVNGTKDFNLSQNYPNPFNPSTKISWQSPVSSLQTLKIYDVLGNEVATLVNEFRNAGSYEVDFDASKLSSGVYFYKLQAGDFVQTKKMILMK